MFITSVWFLEKQYQFLETKDKISGYVSRWSDNRFAGKIAAQRFFVNQYFQ